MKTYAIRLKRDTTIEGVPYAANTQIAAITTEVGHMTLLGLVQYGHAVAEEVADLPDDEDGEDGSEGGDSQASDQPAADGESASESSTPDDEGASAPLPPAEPVMGDTQPTEGLDPITEFVAAGLDQKTAEALVQKNGIESVAELATLLADPSFDLEELEEIGPVRVEKIKAAFAAAK